MNRPDKKININLSDFKELLKTSQTLNNNSLSFNDFTKQLFQEATDSTEEKQNYILWLLADISEIRICRSGKNTFEARFIIAGQARSMLPSDLTSENIIFLQSIYNEIPNKMLKARVADLLWDLKIKPINPMYAEFVIETYLKLPFSEHDAFFNNQLFIKRAIHLARNMKKTDIVQNFENTCFNTFINYSYDGFAYLANLCDFMIENNLCDKSSKEISEKLNDFGIKCENDNNFYLANKYYSRAAIWANKFDKNKEIEYQVNNAKASIHHAEYVSSDDKHGLSENFFYEEALKIIRTLPKSERQKYITEDEELTILKKIRESGQKCLSNMGKYSVPLDLTECIQESEDRIINKTKEEALEFLSLVSSNITYEGLKKSANIMLKDSPLLSMVSKQFYGQDGRILARTKGYDFSKPLAEDDDNLRQWMIFEYQQHIQIHVVGIILPALHIFTNEHNICFRELNNIVSKSTIFPNDRKGIITKGLMAGFEYDFITALHLLSPQIENMVRYQLRLAGVKTSNIIDGIESENGLSTLVKNPEFDQIFGEDLGFEIKALMCDAFGPNLRNNVAHGLLDMNQMQSHSVIYFWWFCLRLVYVEFWNSKRK